MKETLKDGALLLIILAIVWGYMGALYAFAQPNKPLQVHDEPHGQEILESGDVSGLVYTITGDSFQPAIISDLQGPSTQIIIK